MKHAQWILPAVVGLLLAASVAPPAGAQGRGEYFNVESPQVHPIEVARFGGHDYLLVVNTPDNSVEIWDTDETVPVASRFLARVPVGLEPVSVRYVAPLDRFFVANFLGDSITSVSVEAPAGPGSLQARVIRTEPVTDEPLDMAFAFVGETPTLFVTHMTLDAYGEYDAVSLAPVAAGSERLDAAVATGQDIDFDGNLDDVAVKSPRTPGIACGRLFILGFLGGNTVRYDFDLYSDNLAGAPAPAALGGLGSTNWNMEIVDDQNVFVVGAEAQNANLVGEAAVAAAPTGFVKSMLYWAQDPCSANPAILARDVNLVSAAQPISLASTSLGVTPQPATQPAAKADALAQLTDLAVLLEGDTVEKVFVAAFGSDRVGVVEPVASQHPDAWLRRKIDIPAVAGPASGPAGPRGLALKGPNPEDPDDPGRRLYVLNRLENSVTLIDPIAEAVVGGFLLANRPTPRWIRLGREFLYSAELSGNGFVSCSSCHMDARTDGLAWDLSDGVATPIPPSLLTLPGFVGTFPGQKGFIVTQSLQGLLNWEVAPAFQHLFTNAPYHWRGDRATFQSFNPAFVSLLGGSMLGNEEIAAYEEFINSVHYPPNPKQDPDRILSGALGDPDDNDPANNISGSGALKGMKIFFTVDSDGGASCYSCHVLPEGSDNVISENIRGVDPHPIQTPPMNFAPRQPIETAALRGLFQKEARLDEDGFSVVDDSPVTGYEGLFHTGLRDNAGAFADFNGVATLNAFNAHFFEGTICPGAPAAVCPNLQALNQFLHEYDFGSSPRIGRSWTVTPANVNLAVTARAFQDAEAQAAAANASVAVRAQLGGADRGFFLDFSGPVPLYREEPFGTTFTRAQLLAQLTGSRDRMVLVSTPLGSEIRVAAPSGVPTVPTGPPPSAVQLRPMVTNTAYADVPELSVFWENITKNPLFSGSQAHTVRLYQRALVDHGPPGGFGLCSIRHEAPRRFRVAAHNLRHGAALHLFIQNDANAGPPDTGLGVGDPQQVATLELVLPIHPTDDFAGDARVWETAVEAEPQIFYRLMAGRPNGFPGVLDNVTDLDFLFQIPEIAPPAGTWTPVPWNNHWVRVTNADGTSADGGWQALTIEPGPDCP